MDSIILFLFLISSSFASTYLNHTGALLAGLADNVPVLLCLLGEFVDVVASLRDLIS